MNARANKRRVMHRFFYKRFLAWYEPDDGPLTEKEVEAIRKEAAKHLPKGEVLSRKDLFK